MRSLFASFPRQPGRAIRYKSSLRCGLFAAIPNAGRTSKINSNTPKQLVFHLASNPDLAQTIAVSCFGLGIGCQLTGLHTLKIKETDRLVALQTELTKLGAEVQVTSEALLLQPAASIKSNIVISTYQDHRMAMAFAPLALKTTLTIEEAEVVSKSYPNFWNDLKQVGFEIIAVD